MANWDVSIVTNYVATFAYISGLTDASAINEWNLDPSANFSSRFEGTSIRPNFTNLEGTWNGGTFVPN